MRYVWVGILAAAGCSLLQAQQSLEHRQAAAQREYDLVRAELLAPDGAQTVTTRHTFRILALGTMAELDGHDPQDMQLKRNAIETLGVLRGDLAAPVLVRQIDFSVRAMEPLDALADYPAAKSLVSMGSRARRAILGGLVHPMNDERLRLFAIVLERIDDGREPAAARIRFELGRRRAGASERGQPSSKDDTFQDNLQKILRILGEEE